jgi:hypothetical protein
MRDSGMTQGWAVPTGWRCRAGKFPDEKEQVIVVRRGPSGETGNVPQWLAAGCGSPVKPHNLLSAPCHRAAGIQRMS